MEAIVEATNIYKSYKDFKALDKINLSFHPGRIIGLIGPNGAGKTSLLRCMLGLTQCQGKLRVLGKNPQLERAQLLTDVAFIADTAVLPEWMTVNQILQYMQGVHPNFNRNKAQNFIAKTQINPTKKIKTLSKGMVTQLHLALVIAIDAKLLILDEPTLGLDIIYRKRFYEQLLNDYFDQQRTIVITTHQVEEIESLLTDLIFINQGKIVLDMSMEQVAQSYTEIDVNNLNIEQARALNPISERSILGGRAMMFENQPAQNLQALGKLRTPSIAELFVAKMA